MSLFYRRRPFRLWNHCHFVFIFYVHFMSKEHEKGCNPNKDRTASISSLGGGGSGLSRSGGGSGGRGFEIARPGREGNVNSLGLLSWLGTPFCSGMM